MPAFSPERLLAVLRELPETSCYWVSLSGGLDSRVLLEAMVEVSRALARPVKAAHVDHGLHPDSDAWAGFCEARCRELGIPLHVVRIDARPPPGESPEAYARTLRYEALRKIVGAGEMLLTGHHRDDQAETVLLQLLRSAGPHGLAAMPRCAAWEGAWLARPLLDHPRAALLEFALARGLEWIEDPSNASASFDRNVVRHRLLPVLAERWPAIARTLARVAERQADAAAVLDALAALDLEAVRGPEGTLSASALSELPTPRRRNLLRHWLRGSGVPPPPAGRLQELSGPFLAAAPDRGPVVAWPGTSVRRYRDAIHAVPEPPAFDRRSVFPWDPPERLALPLGVLSAEPTTGAGLAEGTCRGAELTVRWRQGGERCRVRGHTRRLKHLLQEAGVPPWRRERLPLVYVGDRLAAVVGLWVCEPFQAGPGEPGWVLRWEAAP